MKDSTEFIAPNLTAEEFKAKIIGFIKSTDLTAEFLHQVLSTLPYDKKVLLEEYRTDNATDPINNDRYKWEREGGSYFFLQLHMAEKNFCLERLKHLIEVKSHLTEHGIAGFSRPVSSTTTSCNEAISIKERTMSSDFSSVDLTGFTPSRSLDNSANNDDISIIRMALFMEMNDKRLSTPALFQAIAWTTKKHPNLFVPYEENAYAQKMLIDTAQWSKDYYHMQEVYASSNFSLERILHMVAVREHVFTIAQENTRSTTSSKNLSCNTVKQSINNRAPSLMGSVPHTKPLPESNILKSLLLIGGAAAVIALIILAVIV